MATPRATQVAFSDAAPPPDVRYIKVVSPRVGAPYRFIVIGRAVCGVYTHWLQNERQSGGGRTVPHTVPDDTCPHCVELGQKPRWHGYLACWWQDAARLVIADITANAVLTCPELNPSTKLDLRGMGLVLNRIGRSNNSPIKATVSRSGLDPDTLPDEFDVRKALLRMWGLRDGENVRVIDRH